MIVWILHALGVEPRTPSTVYNFWSGFGSDVTEFIVLGGIWHSLNCHDTGCWRIGSHIQVDQAGHHIRRCRRHHKEVVR